MNPLSKCVSLETAKRLKAAGFPQDTERWWGIEKYGDKASLTFYRSDEEGKKDCQYQKFLGLVAYLDIEINQYVESFAAPCATEIGELLPKHIYTKWWDVDPGYAVASTDFETNAKIAGEGDIEMSGYSNEAEARASAWLWLRENNLI